MATLIGEIDEKEKFRWALSESDPLVIGRGEKADLKLDVRGMSREHARLQYSEKHKKWMISDLGTTNGTFVNGRKVTTQVLTRHDRIEFGPMTLRIEEDKPAVNGAGSSGRKIRARRPSAAKRAVRRLFVIGFWVLFFYCSWGYYQYMTTMNKAIGRRNEALDMAAQERFDEAVAALQQAAQFEENSRLHPFIRLAYPLLPKKELPIQEDLAHCYYEQGKRYYYSEGSGNDNKAYECFSKSFAINPTTRGLAKELYGPALIRKDWQLALDAANEALTQDPEDAMAAKIRETARKKLEK